MKIQEVVGRDHCWLVVSDDGICLAKIFDASLLPKIERFSADERKKLATRTEAPVDEAIKLRLQNTQLIRLLHGVMGLVTEAGEKMDNLKKTIFYGKPLDEANLKEEMGDTDWYQNLLCDALGTNMSEVEKANVRKLSERYGDKFSEDRALLRDLAKEAKALEG